jgi:hypothetical protein
MAFTRLKKVKGRWYAYLVESRREGGRVVQHVKRYLGPATPAQLKARKKKKRR